MSDHLNPSPEPSKPTTKLKTLLIQGLIGTLSLTGATAIPILVQRALNPVSTETTPASVISTPSVAGTPLPSPNELQVEGSSPTVDQVAEQESAKPEHPKEKRDRRGGRHEDEQDDEDDD
jgi:hypothetical protein